MRFVEPKSAEAQACAVVFRARDLLVRQRTQLINAVRGHLAEFGFIARKGPGHVEALVEQAADPASDLPAEARPALGVLVEALTALQARVAELDREIAARANRPDTRKHLTTRQRPRKTACLQRGVHTRTFCRESVATLAWASVSQPPGSMAKLSVQFHALPGEVGDLFSELLADPAVYVVEAIGTPLTFRLRSEGSDLSADLRALAFSTSRPRRGDLQMRPAMILARLLLAATTLTFAAPAAAQTSPGADLQAVYDRLCTGPAPAGEATCAGLRKDLAAVAKAAVPPAAGPAPVAPTTAAPAWRRVTDDAYGFSVEFPSEPVATESGKDGQRLATAPTKAGQYVVMSFRYAGALDVSQLETLARAQTPAGGVLVSMREVSVDGRPAWEAEVEHNGLRRLTRFMMHGVVYHEVIAGEPVGADHAVADRFVRSFRLPGDTSVVLAVEGEVTPKDGRLFLLGPHGDTHTFNPEPGAGYEVSVSSPDEVIVQIATGKDQNARIFGFLDSRVAPSVLMGHSETVYLNVTAAQAQGRYALKVRKLAAGDLALTRGGERTRALQGVANQVFVDSSTGLAVSFPTHADGLEILIGDVNGGVERRVPLKSLQRQASHATYARGGRDWDPSAVEPVEAFASFGQGSFTVSFFDTRPWTYYQFKLEDSGDLALVVQVKGGPFRTYRLKRLGQAEASSLQASWRESRSRQRASSQQAQSQKQADRDALLGQVLQGAVMVGQAYAEGTREAVEFNAQTQATYDQRVAADSARRAQQEAAARPTPGPAQPAPAITVASAPPSPTRAPPAVAPRPAAPQAPSPVYYSCIGSTKKRMPNGGDGVDTMFYGVVTASRADIDGATDLFRQHTGASRPADTENPGASCFPHGTRGEAVSMKNRHIDRDRRGSWRQVTGIELTL